MKKHFLKSLLCFALALLTINPVFARSVSPLSESQLNYYNANGIYYYTPGNCTSGGYAGTISGSDNEAKIWNYFVSANINGISNNPAAIAGILGNFYQESSYNPFAVSGSGTYYGLYQTNSSSMIAAVNALGDYWRSTSAPEDVNDSAIEIELDFLINDKFAAPEHRFEAYVNSSLNNNIENSAEGAKIYAELFLVAVERAVGGTEPLTSSEAKALARSLGIGSYAETGWQGTSSRSNHAAEVYEKYASSTPTKTIDTTTCRTKRSPYTGDSIPQYFQCGESWSNLMYGPGGIHGSRGTSICASGCGPTSFAMMATALLQQTILPDEVADFAGKQGQHAYDPDYGWLGSSWTITQVLAQHYGLQYKDLGTCDITTINRYLSDGWMIHTSGAGSAPFTSGGHYIGIAGLNSNGEWYIANSASRSNANGYYSPSAVVSAGMKCANVKAIKR